MIRNSFFVCLLLFFAIRVYAQSPCSLDNSFNTDGRVISDGSRIGECIIALPDGSALVAYNPFSNGHAIIRHILLDGTIDNSYGTSGKTTIQVASLRTDIKAFLVLSNELYICGNTGTGSNTYAFVTKLKSNGLVDASFGNSGLVEFPTFYTFNAMRFEEGTNKILVAGMKGVNKATIARLHTNGFMDATFGTLGSTDISTVNSSTYYEIRDLRIDQSNKILITGKHYTTQGSNIFTQLVIMRFNSGGDLDNSFDGDGKAYFNSSLSGSHDEGRRIFVDATNQYYVCGASYKTGWDYSLLKIKNDGSPDLSFGTSGWMVYDLTNQSETEYLLNGEMLSNGHILMTGNQGSGDTVHFALLMVKPDGSRDQNFAPNGLYLNIFGVNNNSSSAGLAITNDGKIYLSGYTRTCTGGTCGPLSLAVARYLGANVPTASGTIQSKKGIRVYPNPIPVNGQFYIDFKQPESLNIHAFASLGQEVHLVQNSNGSYQIQHSMPGLYHIRILTPEGLVYVHRLYVE